MKVFVKTFGCTLNQRDSENIVGILQKNGFEIGEDADIVIVNTCGVKSTTQNKVISYINSLDKPVYVGGCLPRMLDLKKLTPNVKGYFDTNSIKKLVEQIKDELFENFSLEKENRLNMEIVRNSKDVAIIPISQGCLGNCTYCSVRFARGSLKSYSEEEILEEVRSVKDYKKIYLTSQDTGCYGNDRGTDLISLLKKVISIEGKFKVRLGMANPEHILPILKELIEVYKSDKIIKFIHIPVQSGSNKVLKEMGRKYSVEQFKKIVKAFREEIKDIHISTDIIVGFPSESDKDFQGTLDLLEDIKPEVLNVSKFAPRPKTEAANMKQLKSEVIKDRSRIIHNTHQ
ncbi:tRNA (N(6)-L-threonylcarbamoyladenosine(37)-C(2))-methylthiotransferase [archaeon]|jgi:threonylcarbamoyladenosine tRNA methylthiotransferase CDKAL1|nr:tRNA (N(6)-L-threonylcarbamoyladenosine(37)-C(2))-methylthiotransferase [archaeon]MBT4396923.1 tRNA (N(6)-L-threonylcarbamoyladenosine(37)-C(2))-methylthiotransferase [archaeon]MBT4440914.1 tRNA (N(6)-L-threonylcarbamoyladenosine(37)-C(2))-methylthiotransferase [archaeon]